MEIMFSAESPNLTFRASYVILALSINFCRIKVTTFGSEPLSENIIERIITIILSILSIENIIYFLKVFSTLVFILILILSVFELIRSVVLKERNSNADRINEGNPNSLSVSIIIPAIYVDYAEKNISHLVNKDYVKEIVIVNPFKEERKGKIILVKDDGKGRAAALNKGVDIVSGDITVILDEDIYLPEETLKKAIRLFERDNIDILKFVLVPKKVNGLFQKLIKIERLYFEKIIHPNMNRIFGSCGAFRTNVLKDLRFSEDALTEDIDLTVRAYMKGYNIECFSDLEVYEDYPLSFKEWLKQRRRWAGGWFQVFKRYFWKIIRNKKLISIFLYQILFALPLLSIIGLFVGNLFSQTTNLILSAILILPYFTITKKFGKMRYTPFFWLYIMLLTFWSALSSIFIPKSYKVTKKSFEENSQLEKFTEAGLGRFK